MKPVEFLGDSLDALNAFPQPARRAAGFQLDKVQRGYTGLSTAVCVLHCFQKKARKTSGQDIKLAQARYKTLMRRFP